MKYKQIDIKEAADRFRNGEAVYAARCIDGMSFREVTAATMLLVMEIPVPETGTKPEKVKKQPPTSTKKTIDRGKVKVPVLWQAIRDTIKRQLQYRAERLKIQV